MMHTHSLLWVCFYLKEMHKMQRRKLLETMTF